MRITGRVALVTGASSGIGAATAEALARAYPVDLADLAAAGAAAARAAADLGPVEILVNNAGAGRWLFTEETPATEAAVMMAVPYLGAFALTRALLPAMLERRAGFVVNVTSPAAFSPWPGCAGYAAARWAMRGFTEALRADLAGTGVRAALVVPGEVRSPYFDHNPGTRERLPRVATQLYRPLEVGEVAAMVVRAVGRDRRVVVAPPLLRATLALHRVLPRPVEWLLVATGARRPPA